MGGGERTDAEAAGRAGRSANRGRVVSDGAVPAGRRKTDPTPPDAVANRRGGHALRDVLRRPPLRRRYSTAVRMNRREAKSDVVPSGFTPPSSPLEASESTRPMRTSSAPVKMSPSIPEVPPCTSTR